MGFFYDAYGIFELLTIYNTAKQVNIILLNILTPCFIFYTLNKYLKEM
jgi:hypothetical protein